MALTFPNLIRNCFNSRWNRNTHFYTPSAGYYDHSVSSVEDSNVFSKFMRINLEKDIIEIPCVYKYPIMSVLHHNLNCFISDNPNAVQELLIPMMALKKDINEVKTSNAIIKEFFYGLNPERNLLKKKAGGVVYYGGEGIILYEDMTPLMMLTFEVHKEEFNYTPIRPIMRINPIVYNNDDILAKYVRTKIITNIYSKLLAENTTCYFNVTGVLSTNSIDFNSFRIIVEDFSNFFVTPKVPDINFNTESVHKLLMDNMEDLLESV